MNDPIDQSRRHEEALRERSRWNAHIPKRRQDHRCRMATCRTRDMVCGVRWGSAACSCGPRNESTTVGHTQWKRWPPVDPVWPTPTSAGPAASPGTREWVRREIFPSAKCDVTLTSLTLTLYHVALISHKTRQGREIGCTWGENASRWWDILSFFYVLIWVLCVQGKYLIWLVPGSNRRHLSTLTSNNHFTSP